MRKTPHPQTIVLKVVEISTSLTLVLSAVPPQPSHCKRTQSRAYYSLTSQGATLEEDEQYNPKISFMGND